MSEAIIGVLKKSGAMAPAKLSNEKIRMATPKTLDQEGCFEVKPPSLFFKKPGRSPEPRSTHMPFQGINDKGHSEAAAKQALEDAHLDDDR